MPAATRSQSSKRVAVTESLDASPQAKAAPQPAGAANIPPFTPFALLDLPDELIGHIASQVDNDSLPTLAHVSKKLHPTAWTRFEFDPPNYESLHLLLNTFTQTAASAKLVRKLYFNFEADIEDDDDNSTLSTMADVIDRTSELHSIDFRALPDPHDPDVEQGRQQLLTSISKLTKLRNLTLVSEFQNAVLGTELPLLLPACSHLYTFKLALWLSEPSEPERLPFIPTCHIQHLDLSSAFFNDDELNSLADSLFGSVRTLVLHLGVPDQGGVTFAGVTRALEKASHCPDMLVEFNNFINLSDFEGPGPFPLFNILPTLSSFFVEGHNRVNLQLFRGEAIGSFEKQVEQLKVVLREFPLGVSITNQWVDGSSPTRISFRHHDRYTKDQVAQLVDLGDEQAVTIEWST